MLTALTNGRVLTDQGTVERCEVLLDGKRIKAVVRPGDVPSHAKAHDLHDGLLLPRYIDTQVNGGGGVLFGDAPTVDSLRTIAQAHAKFGTTGFLPTLISGDLKSIRAAAFTSKALSSIRRARAFTTHRNSARWVTSRSNF